MNERIKELFEQALEEFKAENKYATIIVPNPLKEKFAKLIIMDCDRYARSTWEHGELLGGDLKRLFGVEE